MLVHNTPRKTLFRNLDYAEAEAWRRGDARAEEQLRQSRGLMQPVPGEDSVDILDELAITALHAGRRERRVMTLGTFGGGALGVVAGSAVAFRLLQHPVSRVACISTAALGAALAGTILAENAVDKHQWKENAWQTRGVCLEAVIDRKGRCPTGAWRWTSNG